MPKRRRATRPLILVAAIILPLLLAEGRLVNPGGPARPGAGSDWSLLRLGTRLHAANPAATAAENKCEQTYGVLPCTDTVVGNLFLLLAYGFLMFQAATYLSSGSEILLELLGPGIVGGLFLPILGALPDAILIFVSGISGSKETAQQQVLIGMGLLAGSTVMLLTVLWGSCVVVGKCDLSPNQTSVDSQDTKGCSLLGSGITTDNETSYAARIMVASVIPFIIVQLPRIFKFSYGGGHPTVVIALIVAVALLFSYCLYQIYQPLVQKRRIEYAKLKHVISGILKHAHKHALGRLLDDEGQPNIPIIWKLFQKIDTDSDNEVTRDELRALIIGFRLEDIDLDVDEDDAIDKVMKDLDTSGDNKISPEEFENGISKWLLEAKRTIPHSGGAYSRKFVHDFHERSREEHGLLVQRIEEGAEEIENPTWIYSKATLLLLLGTAVAAIFADPLVDAVDNFSSATKIPSFFISFIAMPLATNSSEAVSAIIFASRKKQRTTSLTFSEIYGAVTMNNTLCLAIFLALVYIRDLTWDFSSEVLIILIVCLLMGLFASFRTTFKLWTCSIAFLLYPLSLVLVYVLDYIFGWS